jgi:hypothetical protein
MRGLRLSPIGTEIVLALSQVPDGLRLTELATVTGSAVSSIQGGLRALGRTGLVMRGAVRPLRYRLASEHAGLNEVTSLAAALPEPIDAISIVLRANRSVEFASYDALGFVVSQRPSPNTVDWSVLDEQLERIRSAHPESPPVLRLESDELDRYLRIGVGLRARLTAGIIVKGRVPPADAGSGNGVRTNGQQMIG